MKLIHDHATYSIGGKVLSYLLSTTTSEIRKLAFRDINRIIGCPVWTDGDISLEQVKTNAMRDQVMEYLETEGDEFEHGMGVINEAIEGAVHCVLHKIRIDRKSQKAELKCENSC